MIRRTTVLRRFLLQKKGVRSFHTTSVLAGDALDMRDTFARRHCK